MLTRRGTLRLLAVTTLSSLFPCAAADAPNVVLIGLLRFGDRPSSSRYLDSFKRGLRDFGYVEGKNLQLEVRYADGVTERLASLARELVDRKVRIIVTTDTPSALAAKQATNSIPIVMATASDPVGSGIVSSLSHPGGHVTGSSNLSTDISPKHVDLLIAVVKPLRRVAVLANPSNPSNRGIVDSVRNACERSRLDSVAFEADSAPRIDKAFDAMGAGRATGLIVAPDPFFSSQQEKIAGVALTHRLPTISAIPDWADQENVSLLMGYGQNIGEQWRRAAAYCDKILRGASPGDLPIEQSVTLEFVINLKTARGLNLSIPQDILIRADRVLS